MSAQTSIVINDGASTPVARTFAPKGVIAIDPKQTKATWRENAGLYLGQPTIEEYHSAPNGNGVEKLKWVIKKPVLQTVGTDDAGITPPAGVAYTCLGVIEVHLPVQATAADLSDLRAFIENFAATSMFETAVEERDAAW
jgi:hypothetical protein